MASAARSGRRGPGVGRTVVLGDVLLRTAAGGRRWCFAGAVVRHGSRRTLSGEQRRYLDGTRRLLRRRASPGRAASRRVREPPRRRVIHLHSSAVRREGSCAGWGGRRRLARGSVGAVTAGGRGYTP